MDLFARLEERLRTEAARAPEGIPTLVEAILDAGLQAGASDIHVEPCATGLLVRFRLDGVLVPGARVDGRVGPGVVARLKVLAELLTYRSDVPQEGRLRTDSLADLAGMSGGVDLRLATFPTVHGEKAIVRIFDPAQRLFDLTELGLPTPVEDRLTSAVSDTTGAVLLSGPAGSGKTTTLYACLRHIVHAGAGSRHIVSLEDPVEAVIEGVTQTEINPAAGLDFARGLRSVVRQDPDVILVGEIRDRETATAAMEVALTGHLMFSTVHAGSACGVLARLLEMGIEPHVVTSAVRLVIHQRLARRLCPQCRTQNAPGQWQATGCAHCRGVGYTGRLLLAEAVDMTGPLRQAVLARADVDALEASAGGRDDLLASARDRRDAGLVDDAELHRVLGRAWPMHPDARTVPPPATSSKGMG